MAKLNDTLALVSDNNPTYIAPCVSQPPSIYIVTWRRLTKQPDILYPSSAVAVELAGTVLAEDRSTFVAVGEARRRMGLGRNYDTY